MIDDEKTRERMKMAFMGQHKSVLRVLVLRMLNAMLFKHNYNNLGIVKT